MHELHRNQTILAFWAPLLKIAQLLFTNTPLRTFLSKCRIFTPVAAIYPEITSRTVFKKKKKKIKAKGMHFYLFAPKS